MTIKCGDTLFLRCRETNSMSVYASVRSITDEMISCDVLNGGWTLDIIKAKPPAGQDSYQEAMAWAQEHFKGLPKAEPRPETESKEIPF